MCTPRSVVAGVMLVVVLALLRACGGMVCSDAERAVLAEFPQAGGARPVVEPNADTGACAVYYQVADEPLVVHTYVVDQLTAHGWTVEPQPGRLAVADGGTLLSAQCGAFTYTIYYESLGQSLTPQEGTHLAVHVSER